MASQPKLKKLSDNNSYYECEVIKASTLRPMNKSISEKDRVVYESRCKLKLFSTYVKVMDCKSGIEEVFNLNRKTRIEWIWNNNEYKNNVNNFLGFILCLSLEPESKQEQEIMNLKMNLRNGFSGNSNSMMRSSTIQGRNFSLISLNYENNSTTAGGSSDIENEQSVKIQTICYFLDSDSRNHVIQYFKMRVIQRNFHQVYRAVRKLGKGSFASVYLVNLNDTDKHFAIKAFLKEKLIDEDKGFDSFYNEIMLMRCVKNKNILRLIEIWESANSYYLIMPVCHGGSLLERIALTKKMEKNPNLGKEKDLSPIDNAFTKSFMKQLLEAILSLKQQGILHRDIKPDNILLYSRHEVDPQIIDFGLGTFQNVENYIYPKCGTPGYVAPEIINMKDKNGRYDSQCDVFSLGAIFYFLLTLKPLFMGKVTKETIELNKRCLIDFACDDLKHIDACTMNLLQLMLEVNPMDRITPEQALAHPYFVDNFLDEDFDIPDDPVTNINQTLSRINDERPFDMQRINNHSTLNKLSTKIDQSLQSFNLIDGTLLLKKESSLLGTSLVMKQPIAKRNIGGKQISLDDVIIEEEQAIRPRNFASNFRQESSISTKLKHKGTFEQQEYEYLEESHKLRIIHLNKEKSTEDSEKEDSYGKQKSKIQNCVPLLTNSNTILKRVLKKGDSLQYENSKPMIIKKLSEELNAK